MVKIREEFPITMPRMIEANPTLPACLLRKLMPSPAHWSGQTPRWRTAPAFPAISCTLKLEGNEPVLKAAAETACSHPGPFFADEAQAVAVQKEFVRNFFSIQGKPYVAFLEIARKHGGVML